MTFRSCLGVVAIALAFAVPIAASAHAFHVNNQSDAWVRLIVDQRVPIHTRTPNISGEQQYKWEKLGEFCVPPSGHMHTHDNFPSDAVPLISVMSGGNCTGSFFFTNHVGGNDVLITGAHGAYSVKVVP